MTIKVYGECLLQALDLMDSSAERNRKRNHNSCRRKAVATRIVDAATLHNLSEDTFFNGPSDPDASCTNEVGNCGCAHSEPKAMLDLAGRIDSFDRQRVLILVTYSPCTSCANVIVSAKHLFDKNAGTRIVGVVYKEFTQHDPRGCDILNRSIPVLSGEQARYKQEDPEVLRILNTWQNWK